METLEFILHPDGRVEERIHGLAGADCRAITEAIEQALGTVTACELTAEYFAQPLSQNQTQTAAQSQTW
ncbi:MAG: DUF2997 domain-containing protein [Oscillatoriales cyanobacterium SM2_1_8]|nr:DUF2997 domain-containing protein [Oscillatoriales cyanobacterium SM2_1_8]